MKRVLLFSMVLFSFAACEKNIDFNLQNVAPLLVVDAQIENGLAPLVVLTQSFGYFHTVNSQVLQQLFVHNADVYIDNGTRLNKCKEFTVPIGGGYSVYYYGLDSSLPNTQFLGQFNTRYRLTIKSDGKVYNSSSTIPLLAKFPDSLWFKRAPFNPDTNARILMARTTDPPGLGNYIRYFTKKNSGGFLPGANSVFDDAVIDGTTYELQVDPGIDRNAIIPPNENYFRKGDTVTLKLCNIDKASFTFWNTWEFAQQSIGNPFAQPNSVIGNISSGALGAFCGYAAWYKTIVAR